MEKNWYVVHTYSGYENKVKANLEKRVESMGMSDKIFRVIVPEEEETEVKNGKTKTIKRKVFPGYVLVEIVMTDDSWYVVRNTPGVTGFVGSAGSGSKPTPLLPEEADRILKSMGMVENVRKLILKSAKQLWSKKDHSLTFPVKWTKWTTTKVKRKSWLTCSDVKRQSKWISTKSKNFKMCNLYIICGGCFIREATKWTKQSRFIWNLNEKPIF